MTAPLIQARISIRIHKLRDFNIALFNSCCRRLCSSRAAKKQHILESRLAHLRNLLEKYVGPAQSLGSTANTLRMGLLKYVYHVHKDRKRELLSHRIVMLNWRQVLVFTRIKHGANRLAD